MATRISLHAEVPENLGGKRLDQAAAQLFPDYSRARLQDWIRRGLLTVNQRQMRPRDRLQPGDQLRVEAEQAPQSDFVAEAMALDIVHQDAHLLVLNKPSGTVVHPAAGNRQGTLLNGLLHQFPELAALPRAGIVHRLDKDTSGLLAVARTLQAHAHLVQQLQARSVGREYEAVVQGVLTGGGTVDQPLGRNPVNRKKRAVVASGKPAVSHYRVIRRFRSHTHVEVKLETGRTHQIRVHMAHIGHPLVGDPLYGGRLRLPAACSPELADCLSAFRRQALHARRLQLMHPASGQLLSWEAPLPDDFLQLLAALSSDAETGQRAR